MRSLYISATEPRSGKSAVAIGLIHMLQARVDRVGYLKTIGYGSAERQDYDVELIRELFSFDFPPEMMNPFTFDQVREMLAAGREDELLTKMLRAHNHIAESSDVVLIEGTDYIGTLSALELDINADVSKTLDAPVLMVATGANRTAGEIVDQLTVAKESFDEKGCDIVGVIVTQVDKSDHKRVQDILEKELSVHGIDLLGVIPYNELLGMYRMGEIARKMEARVMFGHEHLNNLVSTPRIAAMTIGNALDWIKEGVCLITPGDREDMILAAMVTRVATTYPNIGGIILTGGFEPSDSVKRLIGGLTGFNMPILQVPHDTYETSLRFSKLTPSLYAHDTQKINAVYNDLRIHVKREKVYHLLEIDRPRKTTPLVFLNNLLEKAASDKKRIVLPEGDEERTLMAVTRILSAGIADIILLGKKDAIREAANRINAKIENATIIDPADNDYLEKYAETYFELRKHKGMSFDHAHDQMTDPIFFGTMMVHLGDADGLVSGAVHTTRHTITPSFQIIKTKPGISLVSSIFFMCLPDRVLVYGDCAVNPNPTAEQLAEIAISSAETARGFGFDPLVAMLSYSTGASGVGPEVEHVREATELVKKNAPDLKVEGPIQYDAAVSPDTARAKMPESAVAGKANIFIFPDLNAGNTAYKAVQRSAKAIAVGPVLQGLAKPINDLSRGAKVEDIVYTIAITAIQAQQN